MPKDVCKFGIFILYSTCPPSRSLLEVPQYAELGFDMWEGIVVFVKNLTVDFRSVQRSWAVVDIGQRNVCLFIVTIVSLFLSTNPDTNKQIRRLLDLPN